MKNFVIGTAIRLPYFSKSHDHKNSSHYVVASQNNKKRDSREAFSASDNQDKDQIDGYQY